MQVNDCKFTLKNKLFRLVTPLDVVKVRLQGQLKGHASNPHPFLTASETFIKILRQEGWLSLYRGFLPTMAMSLPGTVVYFVGYERVRDYLVKNEGIREEVVPLAAGSLARIFAATSVSPLELIRTRMQFKGIEKGKLRPVIQELIQSIKQEGFNVLWRGLQPTLWRDVPFSAIYWSILEPTKSWIIKKFYSNTEHQLAHNTLVSFGCGAFSGAIAAVLTTPFDVAKTRQQLLLNGNVNSQGSKCPSTTWHQLKQIWKEDRWKGLTRGMTPRVAKVAPACAIMIGSYEFGKSIFHE